MSDDKTYDGLVRILTEAWYFDSADEEASGFIVKTRRGIVDFEQGGRLLEALRNAPSFDEASPDHVRTDLVRLLWKIPPYLMGKRRMLVHDRGYEADDIENIFGQIRSEVYRIIGSP